MRQGLSLKPIAITSDRLRKERLGQTAAPIASPYSKGPSSPSATPAPQGPGPSIAPPGSNQGATARPGGLRLAPPPGGQVPTSPNRPAPAGPGAARGMTPAGPPALQRPTLPGGYQAAATAQDRAGMAPWQAQEGAGVSSSYGAGAGGRYTGEGLWGYSGQGVQPWRNMNDLGIPSNPELGSYRAAAERAAADYSKLTGATPSVSLQRADGGYSQAGPRQAGTQAGGQGQPGDQSSQSSTAGGRGYTDEELKGGSRPVSEDEFYSGVISGALNPDEWAKLDGTDTYVRRDDPGYWLSPDGQTAYPATGDKFGETGEGEENALIPNPDGSDPNTLGRLNENGEWVPSSFTVDGKAPEKADPLAEVRALLDSAGTLQGIDQSKVEEMVNAARRKQALESSQAMIMASEAGARSRLSPEATAGMGAEISQRGGIEQANTEAKIRLESEIQNMQARMVDYQGRLQNLRMLAAMSQDAQTRQAAIEAQKEMMRYAAELQAEIDGAQSQLASAFGLAGSGAMAGAGFGSMFGPMGAGVGAGVGGGLGFLSGLFS